MKNRLKALRMIYQPLLPIETLENFSFEVGMICIELSGIPIHLEFNTQERFILAGADQEMIFEVLLSDQTFQNNMEFYRDNPYKQKDFCLTFFQEHYDSTLVTEIPTIVLYRGIQTKLPITIKTMELVFVDGSILDYTSKLIVGILNELAETA